MDKREIKRSDTETQRDKRTFSSFNLEEGPKSITIWKDGDYWLIYDQAHNAMTQGRSYQEAVFMLSDLLECTERKGK